MYLNTNARLNARNEEYLSPPELLFHAKREEFAIQLRKSKRNLLHSAKRFGCPNREEGPLPFLLRYRNISNCPVPEKIQIISSILSSEPPGDLQTMTLQYLATILKKPEIAHADACLDQDLIIKLLPFLSKKHTAEVSKYAASALCNLAYHDSCSELIIKQFLGEILLRLQEEDRSAVEDSLLWVLGNVSGASAQVKQAIRTYNLEETIDALVVRYLERGEILLVEQALWVATNLACTEDLGLVAAETLMRTCMRVFRCDSARAIDEALITMRLLLSSRPEAAFSLAASPLLEEVVKHIDSDSLKTKRECLYIVSHLCAMKPDSGYIGSLLRYNVLNPLSRSLFSSEGRVKEEVYFILSNIIADLDCHREAVLEHPILGQAIRGLSELDRSSQIEASHSLANLSSVGSYTQILKVLRFAVIPGVKVCLSLSSDCTLLLNVLKFISGILKAELIKEAKHGAQRMFHRDFAESGCLDALVSLMRHPNDTISEKTRKILENHYECAAASVEASNKVSCFDF